MKQGRPNKTSSDPTLSDLGISRDQSSKWQKLAEIPKEEFEAMLARPEKPTTEGMLRWFQERNKIADPLFDRVDEFSREHGLASRAEAMRWLIQAALDKKLAPKAAKKGE